MLEDSHLLETQIQNNMASLTEGIRLPNIAWRWYITPRWLKKKIKPILGKEASKRNLYWNYGPHPHALTQLLPTPFQILVHSNHRILDLVPHFNILLCLISSTIIASINFWCSKMDTWDQNTEKKGETKEVSFRIFGWKWDGMCWSAIMSFLNQIISYLNDDY